MLTTRFAAVLLAPLLAVGADAAETATRIERYAVVHDGQFRLAHDLAVASDGAVYVVDAWGQRVQKFIPQ